jgi:hypothetical protein
VDEEGRGGLPQGLESRPLGKHTIFRPVGTNLKSNELGGSNSRFPPLRFVPKTR